MTLSELIIFLREILLIGLLLDDSVVRFFNVHESLVFNEGELRLVVFNNGCFL